MNNSALMTSKFVLSAKIMMSVGSEELCCYGNRAGVWSLADGWQNDRNINKHSFLFFRCSSRECWPVGCSGDRAVPAAWSAAQTHRHWRVQEQRLSDLATQRPWGRSRCHLLHHRGLQVSERKPERFWHLYFHHEQWQTSVWERVSAIQQFQCSF